MQSKNAHHIFGDVVVVDEEGSGLIVDSRHGSIEVHTTSGPHRPHIHLLRARNECRQSSCAECVFMSGSCTRPCLKIRYP